MARILIVDDASIMRKNLKTILAEAGHAIVAEASNGSQAYIEYVKHRPDLVTMDITMPYMNGLDTLKKIINDYPDARIIIISSTNNNKVILEAIQSGAKNYIIKPFMVDKVLDVVNQVLQVTGQVSSDTIDRIYKNMGQNELGTANTASDAAGPASPKSDGDASTARSTFHIKLKNNTFIISIDESIDRISFDTLRSGLQGILMVKPLKVVFDFGSCFMENLDCLDELIKFSNKAVKAGGNVLVVTQNKDVVHIIKDRGIDSSINFYSNLSDLF